MTSKRWGARHVRRTSLATVVAAVAAGAIATPGASASPPAAGAPAGQRASAPAAPPASAADPPGPHDSAAVSPTGGVIVRFRPGTAAAVSSAARDRALDAAGAGAQLDAARPLGTGATLVTGAAPEQADEVAARLSARPDVAYAEPDVRLRLSAAPNDPYYGAYQWDLSSRTAGVDAQAAWPRAQGAGVTVAVVDTGIVRHPDLAGRVLPGYDFISDARTARDGGGRDADPSDMGDWLTDGDCGGDEKAAASTWHGTHVAGTIAAVAGNGIGIAGIAPKASILPVRAIGRCGGSLSDIADGITWATGGKVAGVPVNTRPARVVNLSLGGPMACPATLQTAIDGAIARRAVVVTASGNSGISAAKEAPGNCAGVVNVAATTSSGSRASYSNYGSAVTLAAPGGQSSSDSILSTVDGGARGPEGPDYAFMVGTSMAAPHVTAVAALVLSADPTRTPAQVRAALVASARPFPGACSGCGAGIVDAGQAVAAVLGPLKSPATPKDTPNSVPGGTTSLTTTAAPVPATAAVPSRVATTPTAALSWSTFDGAQGSVRYDVQWRPITVVSGARRYGGWTTLATGTRVTTLTPAGTAGSAYQFRVRGRDAAGVLSAWSRPTTVAVAADLGTRSGSWTRGWVSASDRAAVGGTLRISSARGAAVTLPATYASGAAVVAATGPRGGSFDVYVDGRRAQRVTTASTRAGAATTVATVRMPYGRHTIRIVRVSGTVALDAIATLR